MLFGHNTNVKAGEATFHVQTEDRGTAHALIDSTVYFRGHVLHRRTNNYFDLLPLNPDSEQALKLRLDEQHRTIVEALRSGALQLAVPRETKVHAAAVEPAPPPKVLTLVLINAKTWLAGKRATLEVSVQNRESGEVLHHARVVARIEGAAQPNEFATETGIDGRAELAFDMPPLTGPESALAIEASDGDAKGQIRFQLRAKPRVPAAS